MVCPSEGVREALQVWPEGHLHWRSTRGVSYVSTLLQTDHGEHTGRSSSLFYKEKTVMSVKEI